MAEKYGSLMDKARVANWEFDNIRIGHAISSFDNLGTHAASNDTEYVRLHFGLKGDYEFTYKQLSQSFDLAGGHHNIMYSKGIDLEVYNKTLEIETFGVDFPKEKFIQFTQNSDPLIDRFAERIVQGESAILSPKWGTVDAKIQNAIDDILLNPYAGQIRNVFLLAKGLELLVLCVENYKKLNETTYTYVKSRQDKEKIVAARDFINDRITQPPNLTEIAKEVGLNEFKLKNGFKEVFHSTVFGYLTERRLNRARQMLLDTEMSAAEVSVQLGYSSPQHFNKQFRSKFGATPNSIRNNP
ncbi:MAG: AraC family transcriptional regulator [Bacteroidota bacterium]